MKNQKIYNNTKHLEYNGYIEKLVHKGLFRNYYDAYNYEYGGIYKK